MNNQFNRLSSGQNWLDNAYSEEDAEAQARKLAQGQVKALQAQASDLLREKIGDSAVEAIVGAGAVAAPFVKRALGMSGGTSGVTDKVSDAVGNVSKQFREGVRGVQQTAQTAREQARQAVQKASQQAQDISDQGQGVVERIQQNIKAKQDELAGVPEETQTALAKTASRIDQFDIPTVSVPQPERLARSQAIKALRDRADQEFGPGSEDALREIPQPDIGSVPKVFDPSSLTPKEVEAPTGGFAGVSGVPDPGEIEDTYGDIASQNRMAAERYDLPTIQDYKKVDAVKKAQEEAQRVQNTQPESQPIEEVKPYTPPSQQTGGLDPSSLPEGAGARGAGGQAIPAQRPPAQQIQQRGLQEQAFNQDPEEDIRTGETLESSAERGLALQETGTGDLLKSAGEDALAPIKLDIPEADYLPEGFGDAEEAPDSELEEQEKKAEPQKAEEPEEDPEGFGKDIKEDVGEDIGEDIGEEATASLVPGVGELAIAAVGVGQLISGLINKHKQNDEEASQQAQALQAPRPSVAMDPSNTFDSTFR